MYCDPQNKLFILFLQPSFKLVQSVNKLFESNTADKTKLLTDLSLLIKSVANMLVLPISRFDVLVPNTCIENFLDYIRLGYRFEKTLSELHMPKNYSYSRNYHSKKGTTVFNLFVQRAYESST